MLWDCARTLVVSTLLLVALATLSAAPARAVNASAPGGIEAYLGTLTEAQARAMLLENLKEKAALAPPPDRAAGLLHALDRAEARTRAFLIGIRDRFARAREEARDPGRMLDALGGPQGRGHAAGTLARAAGVILCALAALLFVRRILNAVVRRQCAARSGNTLTRLRIFLARVFFHSVSLGGWFCVYALLMMVFIPDESVERQLANLLFGTLTYAFALEILAQLLLSPGVAQGRVLPLSDSAAGALHTWLVTTTAVVTLLALASLVMERIAAAPDLGAFVHASAGMCAGLLMAGMILWNRRRVNLALQAEKGAQPVLGTVLAEYWQYAALAYALVVGVVWSLRALATEESLARLVLSLFLVPVFVGIDLWCRRLLAFAAEESVPAGEDAAEDGAPVQGAPQGGKSIGALFPIISSTMRLILVLSGVFLMLRIWGVSIPMGWLLARNVMGVLLVVMSALVFWEIVRVQIDRKLREEMALSGIDPDEMDEGGGVGSRTATLLVLLRKFVLTVIVVLGTLSALSSMGVDIAPLIAGAGVFGLAIGFGAQTLVKDIISGVFFLIDDAFRVGDYVEAGSAKGTVEQISLRSMKLRHPRGMVYNVPYGSMKILQNFSRDYIVSKLDFRIRYDADIDKIRKVIKKINKEMQADESFRRILLGDIKSNGVRAMEDSAMILRVKFRTLPGHQFVMHKEVYRRVQEAFRKNGIEFAHRNVTVYLPPEIQALVAREAENAKPATAAAIGGAAAAALLAEEEQALAAAAAKAAQAEGNSE